MYVESAAHKLTHKLQTPENFWPAWRWPENWGRTCRSNN